LAITRQRKEELVKSYVEKLQSSRAIIVTDYRGLTVNELQALRRRIREAQGSYSVAKNTLAKLAIKEAGLPAIDDLFVGPAAISFCHEEVPAVARALTDFAKDHERFEIKGGLLGTQVLTQTAIKDLADLPPLEVVRAQLLGLISAPSSRLAGVVAGGLRQMVNVINAYAEQTQ
jgi:large subunit ribosomal protein L10